MKLYTWPKGTLAHIMECCNIIAELTGWIDSYPPMSVADEMIAERDCVEKDLHESIRKFDNENVTVPW